MAKRLMAISFLALLLLAPYTLRFSLAAKEEPKDEVAKPVPGAPFTGKVLAVFTNEHAETNSYIVEAARFKTIGNRQFLVGKSAATGDDDWTSELPISIAWDSIVTVVEFESIEQYKERAKENHPRAAL